MVRGSSLTICQQSLKIIPKKCTGMRLLILFIVTIAFLAVLSSNFAFAQVAPVTMFQSPRKQIEQGASVEQVKCNDDLILMIKSSYTSLACVKPQTAQKLTERGWGMLASSVTQQNIPILSNSIKVKETDFKINYDVADGKVEAVKADISAKSLVISIKTTGNGTLIVDLPRGLIDPKIKGSAVKLSHSKNSQQKRLI